MKEIKNMKLKMKLTKSEQEFIAENITKFDVVTGITVDEIEVRIHGATLNAEGKQTSVQSSAVYRTNDIKAIYAHAHAQCVEAEKAVNEIRNRGSKGTRVLTYEESMER
jgi:hypothetical protein